MNHPTTGHHLMRVRVRSRVFQRLKEVAQEETERSGDYVSVSDLVRAALFDWLGTHDSLRKIAPLRCDKPSALPFEQLSQRIL